MATIVLRGTKGSALSHTEMDNNFDNLNTDKLENSGDTITGSLTFNTGANTNLVLDEDGIDRSSGSAETLNIQNSGAGAMTLQVDSNTVWHAGNDGSGSGLDADTVDGNEAADLLDRSSHTGTQSMSTISNASSIATQNGVSVGTKGSQSIGAGGTWTPSRGVYVTASTSTVVHYEISVGGAWRTGVGGASGTFCCDGSNMRIKNNSGSAETVYWQKVG